MTELECTHCNHTTDVDVCVGVNANKYFEWECRHCDHLNQGRIVHDHKNAHAEAYETGVHPD